MTVNNNKQQHNNTATQQQHNNTTIQQAIDNHTSSYLFINTIEIGTCQSSASCFNAISSSFNCPSSASSFYTCSDCTRDNFVWCQYNSAADYDSGQCASSSTGCYYDQNSIYSSGSCPSSMLLFATTMCFFFCC